MFIFGGRERVKAQKKHTRVPRSNKCLSGFRKVEENKGDKIRCCGENEELGELLWCASVHGAEHNTNVCAALPEFFIQILPFFPYFLFFCFCFLSGPYNNIEFEKCTFRCNF